MKPNDDQKSDLVIRIAIPRGEAARRWRRRFYWLAGLAIAVVLAILGILLVKNGNESEFEEAARRLAKVGLVTDATVGLAKLAAEEEAARAERRKAETELETHRIARWAESVVEAHLGAQPEYRAVFKDKPILAFAEGGSYRNWRDGTFSIEGHTDLNDFDRPGKMSQWLLTGRDECSRALSSAEMETARVDYLKLETLTLDNKQLVP